MEVAINTNVYQQAFQCAQEQGQSLSAIIEDFLVRFIRRKKAAEKQPVPDVVLSLLGACDSADDGDLNFCVHLQKLKNTKKWHE